MKIISNPCLVVLLLGILGLSTSSCTEKILNAGFEDNPPYAVVDGLDADLPGEPAGDVVRFDSQLRPYLSIQTVSTSVPDDTKGLLFKRPRITGDRPHQKEWFQFRGLSTDMTKPMTFLWTARLGGLESNQYVIADISDGAGIVLARVHLYGDGQIVYYSDLGGTGDRQGGDWIGRLNPNLFYTLIVSIDPANRKASIIIRDGNTTLQQKEGLPVTGLPSSLTSPANPTVAFRFDEQAGTSCQYLISQVNINR